MSIPMHDIKEENVWKTQIKQVLVLRYWGTVDSD